MTHLSQPTINDLDGLNQHIVCVLNAPSRPCTYKEKNNMSLYQLVREDLYNNIIRLSHNIYNGTPGNPLFDVTPLAFIILTKVFLYILLTAFTLVTIYYTLHMVCLIDDACFAQNYGVKI